MNKYGHPLDNVMFPGRDKVLEAKARCGANIETILENASRVGIYEALGAVEILVASKLSQGLPTSISERIVFALIWFARETSMGGFYQFYQNSAGDFWTEVLEGLRVIGDHDGLALYQQVLTIFPNSMPCQDRDARLGQLEKLEDEQPKNVSEHFNSVNQKYFAFPFPNWDLLYAYAKLHAHEFDLSRA